MRFWTALAFILFATPLMAESSSNQALKECLLANGYSPEKFHSFDFTAAADCHSNWRVNHLNEEYIKLRMFLAENPWYTGSNWQWETEAKAGYECIKYHDNGVKICRKPYYAN